MIDWQLIGDAVSFYKSVGFEYIEVDWWVTNRVHEITCPKNTKQFHASMAKFSDAFFVGSAEQSLLQMILDRKLGPGKYVAVSPCFRDEIEYNDTTRRAFIKVELMHYDATDAEPLLEVARKFMERYINTKLIETHEGRDIYAAKANFELGSYGVRKHKLIKYPWAYGTGIAEPRFSHVLRLESY